MSSDSYLYQIKSIDDELRRLNAKTKILREQRRKQLTGLHQYMKSHNLEQVGTGKEIITFQKCDTLVNKQKRVKLKPKNQRKAEELELLKDVGVSNAAEFYEKLEKARKGNPSNTSNAVVKHSNEKRSKKKKEDYDDCLGF